jgi:glycosyltransferase involved in cell wall biosynthesis
VLDLGVTVHYLPRASGNFDRRCIARTAALCRSTGAGVFHCDNTHTSPLIGAWLAGVPVRLWSKHAMEPAYEAVRAPSLRERLAPSLRVSSWLATRVLPISRAIEAELVERGIPPRKLLVVPLPIAPDDPRPAAVRDGTRGPLVFGTIGRSVPVKGWDVLLRALAAIAGEVPSAHARLVGSTAASDERAFHARLAAIVAAADLTDRVAFTGHSTDIVSELAKMDVFVLPSRSEGYSLALLEALQAGLPVVSTRVGIAPEVVADGVNGLLVDREDVEGLAAALRRVGVDPDLRARLAAGARRGVPGVPTAAEHAGVLHDLYVRLLTERG